jgi:hypothetical protein
MLPVVLEAARWPPLSAAVRRVRERASASATGLVRDLERLREQRQAVGEVLRAVTRGEGLQPVLDDPRTDISAGTVRIGGSGSRSSASRPAEFHVPQPVAIAPVKMTEALTPYCLVAVRPRCDRNPTRFRSIVPVALGGDFGSGLPLVRHTTPRRERGGHQREVVTRWIRGGTRNGGSLPLEEAVFRLALQWLTLRKLKRHDRSSTFRPEATRSAERHTLYRIRASLCRRSSRVRRCCAGSSAASAEPTTARRPFS